MTFLRDPENGGHIEIATIGTGLTAYSSDNEKAIHEGAIGEADFDHEEAEQIDLGHSDDIERQCSRGSIKPSPQDHKNGLSCVNSTTSTRSHISRIATNLTSKSKKARLPPTSLPISDLDNYIAEWESQNDPEMPADSPQSRKCLLITLLGSITFISPLASSMFAPAVSFMDADFHNDSTILASLAVSIYVLGYAIGPLILAPLCEIYGRQYVLTGANACFCIWQIGCALTPNLSSLIVFRFLAGVGGSGCITIGGGVIADLVEPDQRGLASSLDSLGPLFGPVVGPICGGFIAQRIGWR
ncbi:uncharacterized protein RAG0_13395 [Rhynchosporium agropyri]|uniref:Major facilitator superfamily (MFS) profile domain-containing protein n=1 Tax=Rhynchosporium agropyri TaxID=914238 RepID=A0A1E1LCH3_9HELO|nr:uncharacterized protein RAG0_13395 [Rhynchosporium agropyri]